MDSGLNRSGQMVRPYSLREFCQHGVFAVVEGQEGVLPQLLEARLP